MYISKRQYQPVFTCSKSTMETPKQCLKLTIKTPERHLWRYSGVFIVSFKKSSLLSWCFNGWHWTSKWGLGLIQSILKTDFLKKSNTTLFEKDPHKKRLTQNNISSSVTHYCVASSFARAQIRNILDFNKLQISINKIMNCN